MKNFKTLSWLGASWRIALIERIRGNYFRVFLGLGVVALLPTLLLLQPLLVTNAQEKSAVKYSDASSLEEALRTGIPEPEAARNIPPAADNAEDAPDEVCGWTNSTVFPITILDQATVTQGGILYTFGGVSTSITANAYKFDGTTWTPIAPLPAALEFPTAVTDGTFIYILGGALTGTGTPQTSVHRYDPVSNTYMTMAPFATGTWNQAAVYLGGKIYKFAGTGPATNSTNVLEIYDVAMNSWTAGAVYPISASFVGAFTDGTFVYGAGGITAPGSVASLKTYRYDTVGNSWDDAAIADLPQTRWGAASSGTAYGAGANSGWVLAGGYVNGTVTASISTSTIRWDSTGNMWTNLPNMTGERARMTGAQLGGNFYVIGGRSIASAGFVGTNSNQKLACIENVAIINQGAVTLVSESFPPGNMSPDPGESVTVSLPLINTGDIPTSALTATLQATGGVTNPSAAQNYGAVPPSGGSVSMNFTFTVDPNLACGDSITLTWTVADGATNYANATKMYVTGARTVNLTENFDGVTAPALPVGWINTQTVGTGINWTTTTTTPDSAPNAAFANDPGTVNAAALSSPAVSIASTDAQLTFRNKYITEANFDGAVLEFSTNGGATWTDILAGGGSFVSGGYNSTISTAFMSPIGGRMAWSGTSVGGYINTVVNLPASLNGQMVNFRWLMATDSSVTATGIWIDNVQVFGSRVCDATSGNVRADFDGDGKTDLSVFRPSEGNWYVNGSTAGFSGMAFGISTDTPVPGDYDGDGSTDLAVFRPADAVGTPDFYILGSNGFVLSSVEWGLTGDIPVTEDYDNDGATDIAVYRPSTGVWYVLKSSGGIIVQTYGLAQDIPVAGDFVGDGAADFTVFRPSNGTWYTRLSGGGDEIRAFGLETDKLVPADYDGDGKDDLAVFRPSDGNWYIYNSGSGMVTTTVWGIASDVPVPGDYDGDGKYDIAVYRSGDWYLNQSTAGSALGSFGVGSDTAVPVRYLPGGGAVTVSYTGPVVAITDNTPAGVDIMVTVSGVGTISDLNFRFDGTVASADPTSTTVGVNHSWVGDLIFKVTSPMGTTVAVFDRPGFTGTGFGCNNNNLFQTTLNDDGGLPPVETQANPGPGCTTTLAFPVGNFSPNNPLSALDGQNANGTWIINVSDNAGGDTGSVRAFSLEFNSGN